MEDITQKEIEALEEFDNHKLIRPIKKSGSNLVGFIAIHRENPKMPSFGATRVWNYDSEVDALKDALRLSKLMSYKAALAGLPCGGAKGVIMKPGFFQSRKKLLYSYAEEVNSLGGKFITGTDVGLQQKDLLLLREKSPYIVGLHVDATKFTGLGIFYSIEVALEEVFRSKSLSERTFAIQGLGKVGGELLSLIYTDAKKIFVSEIDKKLLAKMKKKFPKIEIVSGDHIYEQKVDVFCPCALSHSLNSESIDKLQCKAIIGGANNQLENETIGEKLFAKGILYAPDYVVNAGGLITVVDEFEHEVYEESRVAERVLNIKNTLKNIFEESAKQNRPTNLIANEMAEKIFDTYN